MVFYVVGQKELRQRRRLHAPLFLVHGQSRDRDTLISETRITDEPIALPFRIRTSERTRLASEFDCIKFARFQSLTEGLTRST